VTNAIRRALSSAIAQLRLRSPDAKVRLKAAEIVAKDPSAEIAPLLRQILGREKNFKIKE
jgi:hypothetical protein